MWNIIQLSEESGGGGVCRYGRSTEVFRDLRTNTLQSCLFGTEG
jgi:hypothetical protein